MTGVLGFGFYFLVSSLGNDNFSTDYILFRKVSTQQKHQLVSPFFGTAFNLLKGDPSKSAQTSALPWFVLPNKKGVRWPKELTLGSCFNRSFLVLFSMILLVLALLSKAFQGSFFLLFLGFWKANARFADGESAKTFEVFDSGRCIQSDHGCLELGSFFCFWVIFGVFFVATFFWLA